MTVRQLSLLRRLAPALCLVAGGSIIGTACDSDRVVLADDPKGSGQFVSPDAGDDAYSMVNELTSYCPSNQCPADRVTCPGSRFPCDVNLAVDQQNCGACGHACPSHTRGSEFVCVDGTCQMVCQLSPTKYLDCDGEVDNGCEANSESNDNCGVCGNKCDPDKPCIDRGGGDWGCGCLDHKIYCTTYEAFGCNDPQVADKACNGCGNICDPADGGGKEPLPNAYFGCVGAECGHYKCEKNFADCDGDLGNTPSNGCETFIWDEQNCGGCGIACAPGQKCQPDIYGNAFCACPPGATYCGTCYGAWPDGCTGQCVDLNSDVYNCGACGVGCGFANGNITAVCEYGSCSYRCQAGTANCNGNIEDYCEVNIDSDPLNCGACGNVCDAVAGQACVHGRCAVEPCEEREAGAPQ